MSESKQIQELQNNALNKVVATAQKSLLNYNYFEISKTHAIALINNQKKVFGFGSGMYIKIENLQQLENFTNYFID